jgi:hypothetical protein
MDNKKGGISNESKKLLKQDFSYPKTDDPSFINKIYEKREFNYHTIEKRKKINDYNDLKKHRNKICKTEVELQPYQAILPNIINPDTLFTGLLMFFGPGAGKTIGAVRVAEQFVPMIQKYNTKIHILVPGPLIKESWKDEIIKGTGETYLKNHDETMGYHDEAEKEKMMRQAKYNASQNYKIMSYRGFHKKALGQKIIEHVKADGEINKVKRKTDEGDYERDIAIDKIDSLDNTLLIIDEAHHITNNEFGQAVKKVIRNSKNLRILLLTATPMKNLADEGIELLNLLRPEYDQIDRDLVFTHHKNYQMEYKAGGKDYLAKMAQGYISYYRGADPYTYARQIDQGSVLDSLMFTPLVECEMEDFQYSVYHKVIENSDDTLDRRSAAVSNYVFPHLSADENKIIGTFGIDGLNNMRNDIKIDKTKINNAIKNKFGYTGTKELVYNSDKNKTIGGEIFNLDILKNFSTKFHTCLLNVNELVDNVEKHMTTSMSREELFPHGDPKSIEKVGEEKIAGTAFVYCNLVKIGIEIFEQCLLANGYIEFREDGVYNVHSNVRDYLTGVPYKIFMQNKDKFKHKFYPSTFLSITGGGDENVDKIPEEKKHILDKTFSHIKNVQGKYIKLVLGSQVMTEGITIKNSSEVHILDTAYHLGQLIQVIGRAIRFCVHNAVASEENPYPSVRVYRYVTKIKGSREPTSEVILYQKAEKKYLLVKETERIFKEVAFDCATNYNGNIDDDEAKMYDGCIPPLEYNALSVSERKKFKQCPLSCDFKECIFQCRDKTLNLKHYDAQSLMYRRIPRDKLDYSTFTSDLAKGEIEFCKKKIKEMFQYRYVYVLDDLVSIVKDAFFEDKIDLFEEFFVYKALDQLIPITENDFNNFKDTVYDKYNVPGYLIYRNKYYIFQPFNQNENVPMFYRNNYQNDLTNQLSLYQYFKSGIDSTLEQNNIEELLDENVKESNVYNFNDVFEYYDKRAEGPYVGIIDKVSTYKKSSPENDDIFKIRGKREKILEKKRGTGIPSLKGAVCFSSKDKGFLEKIAKKIGLKKFDMGTKTSICDAIRLRMLYLEKYGTDAEGKKTWLVIPSNHAVYPFPLNLEDRISYITNQLQEKIPVAIKTNVKTLTNGIFENVRSKDFPRYEIKIKNKEGWNIYSELFTNNGFKLEGDNWIRIIE